MRMRTTLVAGVLAALVTLAPAAQSNEARALLEAARKIEVVDGNLRAAIAEYQKIERRYEKSDRAAAAQALLRQADCYDRLGDSASIAAYERIVRTFPDQTAAVATARSKLAPASTAPQPTAPVLRRIWQARSSATPLPDGRYVSYDEDQNLVITDAAAGTRRLLTNVRPGGNDHTAGWLSSQDGTRLVYTWYTNEKNRYDLRLISLVGTGLPTPRVLFDSEEQNVTYPLDWSHDGRFIAVSISRKDRTRQIALVTVSDGTMRVLKSGGWDFDGVLRISPDDRYVAFNQPGSGPDRRDILLISVDGTRVLPAVVHGSDDRLIGWSPDGSLLLFASDRRGTTDLWAQPMSNGAPVGTPNLLYPDVGDKTPVAISSRGSIYLRSGGNDNDVLVGAIDPASGRAVVQPTRVAPRYIGTNLAPDWSLDGKYLAYLSRRDGPNSGTVIVIHDADTNNVVRELRPQVNYPTSLRWSPDGKTLLVSASDTRGRIGVLRIDAQSGESETVTTPRDDFWRGFRPEWSPDGRRIYFRSPANMPDAEVVEKDLMSGAERRIVLRDCDNDPIILSPDGRSIACPTRDRRGILAHPIDGGEARELLRGTDDERFATVLQWTRDGRLVVARRASEGSDATVFVVLPVAGGSRVTLQLQTPGVRLHPDGRRIAYITRTLRRELWVLENVLPTTIGSKAPDAAPRYR